MSEKIRTFILSMRTTTGMDLCPFCGERGEVAGSIPVDGAVGVPVYWYQCTGDCRCQSTQTFDSEQAARDAWNTRASPWIPVSTPPRAEGWVICLHAPSDSIQHCYYARFGYPDRPETVEWLFSGMTHATHWMPKPLPPKEDTA